MFVVKLTVLFVWAAERVGAVAVSEALVKLDIGVLILPVAIDTVDLETTVATSTFTFTDALLVVELIMVVLGVVLFMLE